MTLDRQIPHSEEDKARRERLKKLIAKAPKSQLHLHLDGSLSYEFIMQALKRLKDRKRDEAKELSVFDNNWEPENEEELVDWLMNLAKDQHNNDSKADEFGNWKVFDICNQFLQTEVDLIEATSCLVKRLALQHNVNYMEIRFAPILHVLEGLSQEEVISAAIEGFHQAKTHLLEDHNINVMGGFILCALRSFSVEDAMQTVKLIQSLNNMDVLGFDLAGDEGSFPLKRFEEVINLAIGSNIKVTIHAGEWNEVKNPSVLDNLKLAVQLGVNRIGHGLALRSFDKSDDIFVQMAAKDISVEICMTSNCDNPDKCTSFKEHPLPKFVRNEVFIAGLNVDNTLLAGNHQTGLPNPTGEFVHAIVDSGLKGDDLLNIVEGGYKAAFKQVPAKFIEQALKMWKEDIIPHIENE